MDLKHLCHCGHVQSLYKGVYSPPSFLALTATVLQPTAVLQRKAYKHPVECRFVKGACTRGTDCKYAHGDKDIAILQLDLHKTVVFSGYHRVLGLQEVVPGIARSCPWELLSGCFGLLSALFLYVHHIAPCVHIVLLCDSLHDP